MAIIKEVTVLNNTTIRIDISANAGDTIKLDDLNKVDLSYLDKAIKSKYDEDFALLLNREKEILSGEAELKLSKFTKDLEEKIINLKADNKNLGEKIGKDYELKLNEIKNDFKFQNEKLLSDSALLKQKLEREIIELKNIKEEEIKSAILKKEFESNVIVSDLKNKITNLENTRILELENERMKLSKDHESKLNDINLKHLNELNKIQIEGQKTLLEYDALQKSIDEKIEIEKNKIKIDLSKEIDAKNMVIDVLRSSKNRGTKAIGESLESYCQNLYDAYSLNGFENCSYEKDNVSIKEEGETKGTKADFIFKIFAEKEHLNLLTSICLEMKDEDKEAENKKTNKVHYEKLNIDRLKKNCEYALLVSNLETSGNFDYLVKKVNEYDKMYVIRPEYFVSFLSLLVSLADKYKKLTLQIEKEKIEYKDRQEILDDFENMKIDILDKTLVHIENNLNNILTKAGAIKKAANDIEDEANALLNKWIISLKRKIQSFNINKVVKKIDKL
ncbi:MAG: DUF2130 domain-containing protein [Acholeplasmatales bacterium]|jgi:hypothetical protein|nr:DUF2130 domain-containing protein [Acholeplasmatales bacterium]